LAIPPELSPRAWSPASSGRAGLPRSPRQSAPPCVGTLTERSHVP
jgi:hypothetical protein